MPYVVAAHGTPVTTDVLTACSLSAASSLASPPIFATHICARRESRDFFVWSFESGTGVLSGLTGMRTGEPSHEVPQMKMVCGICDVGIRPEMTRGAPQVRSGRGYGVSSACSSASFCIRTLIFVNTGPVAMLMSRHIRDLITPGELMSKDDAACPRPKTLNIFKKYVLQCFPNPKVRMRGTAAAFLFA